MLKKKIKNAYRNNSKEIKPTSRSPDSKKSRGIASLSKKLRLELKAPFKKKRSANRELNTFNQSTTSTFQNSRFRRNLNPFPKKNSSKINESETSANHRNRSNSKRSSQNVSWQ